ncbi:TPA: primosomal replication protein N'' [Klebsiella quasipneumoniae subsp. quasipneumoniae]|uniref:primosomal replication protein N'' n=1 Tax=Klebsiella quasipneumoniae TaxID=1463165 RepID=UPI00087724AA|nr:primosomal replication protein N'' [Klebsiella quasipneumoniae]SCW78292.1 restart primosome assembly protein PriC [Klebsiella quasipneumoniae]SCY87391.1 restart primosome assembly protein PriC [Klebsiella quasipneumoniae]SCZ68840.1 restart primosome assembly protein PriC [Klebsiella quasipneumoniae]SDB64213.1 restart primosome assembly protein PriC [Klebsiella quasipneumoniae]SEA56223.1 restart primosome assembly protein PriC [Klebsiella quasipneumoniae]
MKTAQLLQTLNNQLSELAALVAPLAEHATLSPRFDCQLFHTRSTLMQAYLAEAQHNFSQLRQAVERQQLPQVAWIAERLAAQIAALRRETATWSLRSWDHASPTLSRWQRRRLQHQEYERRLLAMRDQRQRQLTQATSLDEQQRLASEVEVYSGRLARCRQALDKIENVLARLTR